MGSITPILDTLLPQVLGRAGDVARVGQRAAQGPLAALRPVSGEMSPPARDATRAYPGHESGAGRVRGAAGTRAGAANSDAPSARAIARALVGGSAGGLALERSAELHLSRGGGVLARLLAQVNAARGEPSAASAPRPLTAHTMTPRPAELSALLAQQVTASGLFYESHLAAWVRGQFPKSRLADEPQARLAFTPAPSGAAGTPGGDTAAAGNAAPAIVDPRLAALVRQQLELLSSGVFQWQGEAWSGAPMRWTIESESDGRPRENDGAAPASTALALDLPGIGAFEARLRVAGDRVSVAAWAERGAGRELIAADLETLRRRLREAGFDRSSVRLMAEPAA